ncbi:MAG: class I tRNA ligase family protein, partial [Clostridia bacterium]
RDFEFAKKFNLPIIEVVAGGDVEKEAFTDTETGKMVNSGFLDGLEVADAKKKITAWLEERGLGKPKVNYKLRDWVFSRQRYWGEPIPLVECPKCGWVPIPNEQLPVLLPEVDSYEPTDNGESPLAKITDWVNTTCPHCGGPAKRETDTMPQWAGSSWYFLRYTDPDCKDALASRDALDFWTPVDWYNGGMEHTTLHLLYSRFWHKFLYDIGVVPTKEPYAKRTSHGMILGEGGEKMSKSRGNVVNPNDIIAQYGADTMRLYIMFIGDFEKAAPWSPQSVKGCKRFLDRVWNIAEGALSDDEISAANMAAIHKTIKKVTDDIENVKFNTAIAAMMALVNDFSANGATRGDMRVFIKLLAPFAPHIAEELWQMFGGKGLVSLAEWPRYDEEKCRDSSVEIVVQVCGKIRERIEVATDATNDEIIAAACETPKIKEALIDGKIMKSIVVPGKLVNLIIK